MKKIPFIISAIFILFSCAPHGEPYILLPEDRNFHSGFLTEWQYLNGVFCPEGSTDTTVFTYILTESEHQLTLKSMRTGDKSVYSENGRAEGIYSDTVVMISDSSLDSFIIFKCDSLRLFTSWKGASYDMLFKTLSYPVFIGDSGVISLWDSSSFYYSIPRMTMTGKETGKNGVRKISGSAWLDHQWGNFILGKDSYTWFSINLDNGSDCMIWKLAGRGRAYFNIFAKDAYRSRIRKKGWFEGAGDAEIIPIALKRCSGSGKTYPYGWRVTSDSLEADILILPQYSDFEFDEGSLYQGRCTVEGILKGSRVKGVCQMEITGYYSKNEADGYTVEHYENVYDEKVSFFRGEIEKKLKK